MDNREDLPLVEEESNLESVAQRTPWWAISIGIHALAVMILTYLVVFSLPVNAEGTAHIQPRKVTEPPPQFEEKKFEHEHFKPTDKDKPTPVEFKNPTDDTVLEDMTDEFDKTQGESEDFKSNSPFDSMNSNDVIGAGANAGGDKGGPRGGFKDRRPGLAGGPKFETDDAVLAALKWLSRHQNADGSWNVQGYTKECGKIHQGTCTPNPVSASEHYNVGVSSLSLLAFLGAGYSHLSKDTYDGICFGDVVRKGIQFLMQNQDPEGCIGSRNDEKYMYNHAVGALALTEAYGLTGSNLFRDNAQSSIDFLVAAQNPGKGWRYSYRSGDNDTSVTGWAVMALKSAELSGLSFPRTAYEGVRAWLDEVTEENYYRVGYTHKGTGKVFVPGLNEHFDHHEALTAISVMSRIFMDKSKNDPRVNNGCQLLVKDLPKWEGNKIDFYYWYYASLALYQYGGIRNSLWKTWEGPMKEALVKNQQTSGCKNGSWEPVSRWSCEGGRVYATAINALTLEVYYRYANVFTGSDK